MLFAPVLQDCLSASLREVRDEAISSPKMLATRTANEITASLADSLLAMPGEGQELQMST